MRPEKLVQFIRAAIRNGRRVLVKGKPGIGKTDMVKQASDAESADLVLMHPAVSDPTDYKGMPAISRDGTEAHFLPFGDLCKLVKATKRTVAFIDDIGQAPPAVQAALMQLIHARAVNGTAISPHVVFMGATNDTTHMAGVSGMIEPLKSRWDTIIEAEVSNDDWCNWALSNGMPSELIAFLRFRPALLSDFKPTKEIKNSPCPRTWASVGMWMNDGIKDLEVFMGAVGEGAATELYSFLDMYAQLPSLDAILLDPTGSSVPEKPAALFAVASGLARKATPQNLDRINAYLSRLPKEFEVMAIRDAHRINKGITSCAAFVAWATKNSSVLM